MGDGEQRRGAVAADNGAASIEQFADALLFREEALKQGGMPVADRLVTMFLRGASLSVQKISR